MKIPFLQRGPHKPAKMINASLLRSSFERRAVLIGAVQGGIGVLLALRSRSRIAGGWLALRQRLGGEPSPRFYSMHPTASYGRCFALEQLGPPPLLPLLASGPTDGKGGQQLPHR
jgi:hypothetical protein